MADHGTALVVIRLGPRRLMRRRHKWETEMLRETPTARLIPWHTTAVTYQQDACATAVRWQADAVAFESLSRATASAIAMNAVAFAGRRMPWHFFCSGGAFRASYQFRSESSRQRRKQACRGVTACARARSLEKLLAAPHADVPHSSFVSHP
jgi:hypothetical protein